MRCSPSALPPAWCRAESAARVARRWVLIARTARGRCVARRFHLAAELQRELEETERELNKLVDAINSETDTPAADDEVDSIAVISSILNSHVTSLRWVQTKTDEAKRQLGELQQRQQQQLQQVDSLAAAVEH